MNAQEKYFFEKLKAMPKEAAPGFVLQAYKNGKLALDVEWGRVWKYYDLASLTKIIFTLPWVMKAVEKKKIKLEDSIQKYLPWYDHDQKIQDILSHVAGNDWWQPFFKHMDLDGDRENRKNQLRQMIKAQSPNKKVTQAVYSDIDFFLLGFLIEVVFEKEWLALADELFSTLKLNRDITFHEDNVPVHKQNDYAPTEDCGWRKKLLQGEVHDDNTWAMGGVAPHAGLFGSVDGVAQWGLAMRQILLGKSPFLKAETLKKFTAPAIPKNMGDWGLGYVLPTPGSSSSGQYFSPQSFGHTGFTGTSFWMDPAKDLFIVLLSNRVHPTRKNEEFKKWRPLLHDWVSEALDLKK